MRRRTWRARGVALALALAALGPLLPAQGADKSDVARPRLDAARYPWQVFGRVNRQGSGFCTGVLVGPAVVLTAAHCLYDVRAGLWATVDRMHFVAGYQNQGYAFHAKAARYRVAEGYDPKAQPPTAAEAARDWAVIELEAPAPASLGYLGVADVDRHTGFSTSAEYTLAGYGRDRPYALSADRECRVLGWDSELALLVHDCRAVHGTSGAPVVRKLNGAWLVYGVHVARVETKEGEFGIAVPAGSFFEAVRRAGGGTAARGQDGLEFLPGRAGE